MSESELHKRFKERGWDIIVSIDYCNSIADGTHNTPKPVPEGFPLFTSKNLTASNTLDKTDYYNISEKDLVDINRRSYVNKYDIIFGMIGTIGNPVVITEKNLNFAVKNVGIFRFGGDYYKSSWFYYSLFSDICN
ncbi:type I restriction modification DNA specificity domain protein [Candidatus Magnetomorum sp. HK-1]|nr:type I restriction modification DNA specificity domain protein [Candidatus Magnetomorum sp. HK-1]